MPIIGFSCSICKRDVPLDHYDTSVCGLQIPPDYATAVLHSNDEYYGKGKVTVTAGLGCPRSRALEYDTDVVVDPLAYNAVVAGKAWDKAVEQYAPPELSKVRVSGEIAGIHVDGEIDRVLRLKGVLYICDNKNSNNNAQRFLKKEIDEGKAVKPEYRVQTSLYAELYDQTFGERPTRGVIWNHYAGAQSSYNSVFIPLVYDTIPLAECLAHHPYGGQYSVLELLQQAQQYHGEGNMLPADLPLAGTSMNFGTNTLCTYCQVDKACMTLAQSAPF